MEKEYNGRDIVPDFILGDSLVSAITDGKKCSGNSVCYTLEQKHKNSYVYGMNGKSYVEDKFEVEPVEKELSTIYMFKEAYEKMRKLNIKLRISRYVFITVLALLTVLSFYILQFL